MSVSVTGPVAEDRVQWELLYHGYAEFYQVPMNDQILDTVWGWIQDSSNPFFGLIAKDGDGRALGLMHCRQMPSPLRGAMVGFLDDLFVSPEARGQGVVEDLYRALNALGKKQGWPFIRWITAENNYRGRAIYDRLADRTHWVTYQMQIK
ncbi:MAG: GNAT family N-acetyltransferase [Gammaproteobacteria bacterium]|nr:GNAT family N-acetyltransferase [Gammaproteobacteria bacterium]MDH3447061.1 GNAT family N-acetyltransferase [Gammaproteobacteria bacterium]